MAPSPSGPTAATNSGPIARRTPDLVASTADSATSRLSGRATEMDRVPSSNSSLAQGGTDSELVAALRFELLTTAALEAAIHLPRRPAASILEHHASPGTPNGTVTIGVPASPAAVRAAHAPARRISRTVLCLGHADGPAFGAAALRLVRQQVSTAGDGSGMDALPYWWSNVVHMRAILQGMSMAAVLGGGAAAGASPRVAGEHWASQALVPELRRLERVVFDEMMWRLWDRVLLPTVLGTGRAAKEVAKPAGTTKRAQQVGADSDRFTKH